MRSGVLNGEIGCARMRQRGRVVDYAVRGCGMHDDAKWDLGVMLGESSRVRRLWIFSGCDVEWMVVPMIAGTRYGMVMS